MIALPEAYINRMKKQLGSTFAAYMSAMEEPPRRGGRVNGLKISPKDFFALHPDFVPVGEESFLLPENFAPGKDPFHAAGLYYVQELSAQMPAPLLDVQPGMVVLDLCAAPGGKSAQLLQALQDRGLLVSNEIVPKRAQILCGNLERMGGSHMLITSMEPESLCTHTGAVFDRILVDAPCAGEGMFRKEPEAVAAWSEERVKSCATRQRSILASVQKALKPGGKLVYSTCSFSPEENEETVDWFLSEFPDFSLVSMHHMYPHDSLGEGQFAAVLEKKGELLPTVFPPEKSAQSPVYTAFEKEFLCPFQGEGILSLLPDGRVLRLPPLPFPLKGLKVVRCGLLLGEVQKGRFTPAHALALAACRPMKHMPPLTEEEAKKYLHGETLPTGMAGWCAPALQGYPLGLAKGAGGILKNHLPKGLRLL